MLNTEANRRFTFAGIGGGGFPGQRGGSASSREIADRVQQNFIVTTVGGTAVYDLTVSR